MSANSIRFINSKYDEQFRIPDGGVVEVTYPDWTFVQKCRYIETGEQYLWITYGRAGGLCRLETNK